MHHLAVGGLVGPGTRVYADIPEAQTLQTVAPLRVASSSARCATDLEPGTRMLPASRPGRTSTSIGKSIAKRSLLVD